MLGVLLTILKVILILIGVILGITLLILAVLLFNFCRYEAKGSKDDNTSIKAEFKWLFGIVRGSYEAENAAVKYRVYVPFGICNIKYNSEENNININAEEKNICNDDEIVNKNVANIEKNSKIYNIVKKIKSFFIKIKEIVLNIRNKIKFVQNFNDRYGIRSLINATIKLVIKLIKNLGFKRFEVNGIIGFDEPSQTGEALGAIAVVETFLPLSINVAGNFDEKELSGDFNIKGRTNLWFILFPIVKYIFTKPVWPVVKDYWKGELDGQL